MIITIDGPSGTGKSTLAKRLAQDLGFVYFDTGAMYRAFAWFVLHRNIELSDTPAVENALLDFNLEITSEEGIKKYLVRGHDVTAELRTPKITSAASILSTLKKVREKIGEIQKKIARHQNAVFEGRDMGTVIFPEAELKIFLTATPEVRAERRYLELVDKFHHGHGHALKKEQVLKEMEERDQRDSSRAISPLKKADDAFLIDTSSLNIEEVLKEIKKLYFRKAPKKPMRFFYWLVIFFYKVVLKIFFRFKCYGLKNYYKGPAIIAPNHASFLDPPVIAISCPEEIHFLARESLFRIPIFGKAIAYLNSHPVSRQASDAKVFKQICELLAKGEKILLFPEGTRCDDGNLAPFKEGVGFLAWKMGVPVIPMYIHGTFNALNRYHKFPRLFAKTACVIGKPIMPEEFASLGRKEAVPLITEKAFEAVNRLKKWYESGKRGEPS